LQVQEQSQAHMEIGRKSSN